MLLKAFDKNHFTMLNLGHSPDEFLPKLVSVSASECGPGLSGWNYSSLQVCKGMKWLGPLLPSAYLPPLPQEPGSLAAKFEFCSSSSAFLGSHFGSLGEGSRPENVRQSPGQPPSVPALVAQHGPSQLAPLHHLPS